MNNRSISSKLQCSRRSARQVYLTILNGSYDIGRHLRSLSAHRCLYCERAPRSLATLRSRQSRSARLLAACAFKTGNQAPVPPVRTQQAEGLYQ